MPGRSGPLKRLLIALALAAGPVAVLVAALSSAGSGPDEPEATPVPAVQAEGYESQTVARSPQRPGYTSWVGAWVMPDGSLMTGFVQATGPVDPAAREPTPGRVLGLFGIPRAEDPQRDFWGLEQESRYLRSRDGGRTWQVARSDPFQGIGPYGYTAQATMALKDGTIVRRVNGDDLRNDPSIPHTAYLQRLAPGETEWSEPQVLMDPATRTYQLTRLRYLRDGRLIATGNYWDVPADTPLPERAKVPSRFLLMVSEDEGRTWSNGLRIPEEAGPLPGLEWDTAELANGDLAAVMRTLEGTEQVRKQGVLERDGDGFVLTKVRPAPFPHSGHPELLVTREGPILHIATTGIYQTSDGIEWEPLEFAPKREYASGYYPRSVQTSDGVVHVFGHTGADDPYAQGDQRVTMDTFRLARSGGRLLGGAR